MNSNLTRIGVAVFVLLIPWLALYSGAPDFLFDHVPETTLTYIAATLLTLGPLSIAFFAFRANASGFSRVRLLIVLGSVTPAIIASIWLVLGYIFDPGENEWAFSAGWLMGFFPFAQLASFGLSAAILFPANITRLTAFFSGLFISLIGVAVSNFVIDFAYDYL